MEVENKVDIEFPLPPKSQFNIDFDLTKPEYEFNADTIKAALKTMPNMFKPSVFRKVENGLKEAFEWDIEKIKLKELTPKDSENIAFEL